MSGIIEALIEIQKQLKAPKGQYNSFGKYKYRSAEDILEAVKPLNASMGVLLTLSDEVVSVGSSNYIRATATLTNGKESHSVTGYAREAVTKKGMDDSQITGTSSSYARKYALNGLYLIDDTKDADTDQYQHQTNQPTKNKPQQHKQQQQKTKVETVNVGTLKAKFIAIGGKEEQFAEWHKTQTGKGVTDQSIDVFLTQKMQDKNG